MQKITDNNLSRIPDSFTNVGNCSSKNPDSAISINSGENIVEQADMLNISKYECWLNQKLNTANEDERKDTKEVIDAFQKLSKDEQKEYLSIMTDKDALSEILLTEIKEGDSKSLKLNCESGSQQELK